MGVDYHKVCKCGSYHSEYTVGDGVRICRECGSILSIHGEYKEASPMFGMTKEEQLAYMSLREES